MTDREGVFRVSLPPGTYEVTLARTTGLEFTKSLPATVTLEGGRESWLEIVLDSGVR